MADKKNIPAAGATPVAKPNTPPVKPAATVAAAAPAAVNPPAQGVSQEAYDALVAQNATLQAKVDAKPEQAKAATIKVNGQSVIIKHGIDIPGMGIYTKDDLLAKPEVVEYLLEIKSGSVELVNKGK